MKRSLKYLGQTILMCLAGAAVVFSVTGCTTTRAQKESVPVQKLTFGSIREEVRIPYDTGTLIPNTPITNRFVFPVTYQVGGTDAINQLQVLFDRYQAARDREPVSINDKSAIAFMDIMDTLGGTALPDFTISEEDVHVMTPIILDPWLKMIRNDVGVSSHQTATPRPRQDRP
jgi:hypothetical protein